MAAIAFHRALPDAGHCAALACRLCQPGHGAGLRFAVAADRGRSCGHRRRRLDRGHRLWPRARRRAALGGSIGDRFGKYRACAALTAASAVVTFLCGLADYADRHWFDLRLACGLAAGCIIPLAMAYVGDVIPVSAPPAGARPLPDRADFRAAVRSGRRRRARRPVRLAQCVSSCSPVCSRSPRRPAL